MSDVHASEEAFVFELRLFNDLYGHTAEDHGRWAVESLPSVFVAPYMKAWKQGRRAGWKNLERLADGVKLAAGLDGEAWRSQLMHLQALAGVKAFDVLPTTQPAHL